MGLEPVTPNALKISVIFSKFLDANLIKLFLYFQFLESTKSVLNEDALESVETLLVQEMKTLQQQWISHECQEKFKQFLTKKNW